MCGIFGLIGQIEQERIREANRKLAHRGPDAEGYWFDPDLKVAFCHRRLSILDLSDAGAQPMKSVSERYILTFNGEIYNFEELRNHFPGRTWRGHSDTEVILACFEEWGVEKTLDQMDGMFGLALWDQKERALILARDRMGEKPLYYGKVENNFVFSSELKPIHFLFHKDLHINPQAVQDYFRRGCISSGHSIYQGITKLKPGCWIKIDYSRLKEQLPSEQCYWSLDPVAQDHLVMTPEEAIEKLEAQLKLSVRQQMISDVPLGAFLSGGIDSSLIVSLMQSQSSQKVKTFSIGFYRDSHNEAPQAKAVAQHLGTDHEELYVSEKDLLNQVPRLAQIYDEPFADSSQIPTILVSQMARKKVTVSLSGDGGDELFAGYNRHFFSDKHFSKVEKIPLGLRTLVGNSLGTLTPEMWEKLFKLIPVSVSQPQDKIFKLAQVLQSQSLSDFYQKVSTHWLGESPLLQSHAVWRSQDWDVHSTSEMCVKDAGWYMPDDVLVKVDRAAMSCGLETRAPFLSRGVVELAFKLPINLKIHDGQTKWLLRKLLDQYVPKDLIDRPKMGFGVPLDTWLRKELKDWAEDLLSDLKKQDLLNEKVILNKWDTHQKGQLNLQNDLWDVLMFLAWRRQYHV